MNSTVDKQMGEREALVSIANSLKELTVLIREHLNDLDTKITVVDEMTDERLYKIEKKLEAIM